MNNQLIRSVRVTLSIESAFRLFTEKIDLWWPPGHRRFDESEIILEPRVGGRFLEKKRSGEEVLHGEVIHCAPPSRITYTWYPGAITRPTEVDVRFTDMGDHTLVEICHSEGESQMGEIWSERVQRFERAWGEVLSTFVAQAEQS
ncbi:MAG: SRPBCC domain-containing protein [Candidatus Kapaibacterium sp.]